MHFGDIVNNIILPVKLIIPQPIIKVIPGLTTNEEIRIENVLKCISRDASCLDIGCGSNLLMKKHRQRGGKGIGIDVYKWEGIDLLVNDSSHLPFKNESFGCITFVASLNHIPNRADVLKESYRMLKDDGRIIATTLSPYLSKIWHKWAFWDKDQHKRGMKPGELYGFTNSEIRKLLESSGFEIVQRHSFSWGINRIYIAKKNKCFRPSGNPKK